jgi:ubiquinone/menaquinone biosynthesis C-methylase UbiE/DNA-binding transcriptional ArsR family regulator
MALNGTLSASDLVAALKAAAEPTRLRILVLLANAELNVKDLTQILGQSQPRISRHLKLLVEAGLIERFRDGSWVYFHVSDRTESGRLALGLARGVDVDEAELRRDRERCFALKREREAEAQSYFAAHAADWGRIRSLHVAEHEVEEAMLTALGPGPFRLLLDLGTGTGRTLELFAGRYERGLGLDVNQAMLAYAEGTIARAKLGNAQVRHGDIYHLALPDACADAVVVHQVLHFLPEPGLAIREAARVTAPGGKLLIVDFAPHDHEFLREEHAHKRLGFSDQQIGQWLADAGLKPKSSRQFAPPPGDRAGLTVTLWLAARPQGVSASSDRHDKKMTETPNLEGVR